VSSNRPRKKKKKKNAAPAEPSAPAPAPDAVAEATEAETAEAVTGSEQIRRKKKKTSTAPAPDAVAEAIEAETAEAAPDPEQMRSEDPVEESTAVTEAAEVEPAEVSEVSVAGESGEAAEPSEPSEATEAAEAEPTEVAEVSEVSEPIESAPSAEADADAAESDSEPSDHSGAPEAGELEGDALKRVLQSLIFVSDRTITALQLARAVKLRVATVRPALEALMEEHRSTGIELVEVNGGYQFRSAEGSARWVRDFVAQKPVRLTRAQLETLALVAYRQPITRPEVDDVRGVDTGSAIRVLLERGLIKILGRKDEAGRPLLYGTTPHFLEFFGMRGLEDLPTLREFTELSDENRELFKRKTGESVEEAQQEIAAAEESDDAAGEEGEAAADQEMAGHDEDADFPTEAGGDSEPPADGEAAQEPAEETDMDASSPDDGGGEADVAGAEP